MDYDEKLQIICFVAFVLTVFIGVFILTDQALLREAKEECEQSSILSGHPTFYEERICWIEIQPDLVVRVQDIEKYSHFLER